MSLSLSQYIHQTLRDDATMRGLTGKASPFYGVYMEFPDVIPDAPYITHQQTAESEDVDFPKGVRVYGFTIFGSNRETIKNRIKALFHEKSIELADYYVLRMAYDHCGPDLFDDAIKVHYYTVYFTYTWIQK